MQKRHLIFFVVFNIFLVSLGSGIVWKVTQNRLKYLGISIESRMGNKVNEIQKSNFSALQSSLIETITQVKKSVVTITISKDVKFYVEDPSQLNGPGTIQQQIAKVWWWSGIIISKKWYILTNKHVVQDITAKYSVLLSDGKAYNVDKIWFDSVLDLAVLKIVDEWKDVSDFYPASFLPFDTNIDVGQFALAIGNSLSKYPNNVTMGIIWGKNKQLTINKNNIYIGLYQTDAKVSPWNSGGPLVDINGDILGITTAIDEWEWIAFALPISKEFIEATIKSVENFWKLVRPIIGIQYTDTSPAIHNGIYINDVIADLPASLAGIKIWDNIVSINGNAITDQLPFLYQLYTYIPGETISLNILRDGKQLTLPVLLWWNTQ